MKPIKTLLKKALASTGYTIRRASDPSDSRVRYEHFVNLTRSYEHRLNGETPQAPIPMNDLRPKLLGRLQGTPPSEAYFILQSLARTHHVDGDVCEFGVAQGETSALIANEIVGSRKILHLFDSFEGLPKPTEKDQLKDDIFNLGSMEAYAGTMACAEDMVRARLQAIAFPKDRFVIHKGFFDQVLKSDRTLPSTVAFAYVDFDFYEPIKQVLEFVHPRMPVGGIALVDDYGWFSTGAKTATDEFLADHQDSYKCFVPDSVLGYFAVLERIA